MVLRNGSAHWNLNCSCVVASVFIGCFKIVKDVEVQTVFENSLNFELSIQHILTKLFFYCYLLCVLFTSRGRLPSTVLLWKYERRDPSSCLAPLSLASDASLECGLETSGATGSSFDSPSQVRSFSFWKVNSVLFYMFKHCHRRLNACEYSMGYWPETTLWPITVKFGV